MEQSAVVRFLTLKKLSAKDIATKLEGYVPMKLSLWFGGGDMMQALRQWENHLRKRHKVWKIVPRRSLWMHVTFIKESPFTSCQKLRILNTTCQ
jgi:hypothetical protein